MPDFQKTSGGSTTQNTAPGMNDILGNAKWLFNSGAAWAPNTSSKVTPFSTQTRQALSGMNGAAKGAAPMFKQNLSNVWKTINDGGLDPMQREQVGRLEGIAGGNGLNEIQQQGSDWLKRIAGGGDMAGNPYLDDVIKRSSGDIANADNLMASLSGRYGSGSHQGVLEKNIGDMSSNLRFSDYTNEQGRMDKAITDYFDMGKTGFDQRGDAIGSLYQAGGDERANKLAGTGQLADAFSAEMDPFKVQGQTGAALEGKNQQYIDDASRIFGENKSSMTDPLNWLAALASGFGGSSTTNTSTSNPLLNMLGGGLKGYDMFGGPGGAIFGGLTGAFA